MHWLKIIVGSIALFFVLSASGRAQGPTAASVSGVVRLENGRPAIGAWVRVQTTANLTYAASDGSFTLGGLAPGAPITITAWHEGYKVGWAAVTPTLPALSLNDGRSARERAAAPTLQAGTSVTITLRMLDQRDNAAYAWNTSYPDPANPTLGCGHCMAPSFAEWSDTAHAGAGTNQRFFSLYNGTDLSGMQPVAPGYQQDFPGTVGNCATCHAPGAAYDAPFTTDMNALTGVNREGVFCEFCHKVGAVYLDPATGRPYPNAPGTLSMRVYRPFGADQIFFGSLDDVARRVSYLPLEKRSQFCAPCHQFAFWGTPIYQSYREWQESPYAAAGTECQTCHMPPGASTTFVLPERGGLSRDPARMASHLDLGVKDTAFMQSTIAMTLTAHPVGSSVQVSVTLTNVGAGHHAPTDQPARHMLLVIEATDGRGQALPLQAGPQIPTWGGEYAGRPGKGYAKILQDVATGESPVVNYWKQTRIESDNRIPALGSDATSYTFTTPAQGSEVHVTARLIYRRMFQAVADAKGWNDPDIEMAVRQVALTVHTTQIHLPLIQKERIP